MAFNVNQCKVLHIWSNNNRSKYSTNATEILKVNEEKDLGITISSDLKPAKHCSEVVKTANMLSGFIGRTFEFKTEKVFLILYNTFVRPHLDNIAFISGHRTIENTLKS